MQHVVQPMKFIVHANGGKTRVDESDRRLGGWPAYVDIIQRLGLLFGRGRYTKSRGNTVYYENDVDEFVGDGEFQAADEM